MGQPQSALEDALAFTRLLGYSNPQQTIAIGLNAAFRETRRDQADEIIEYVLTLSESVDVVLGGSEDRPSVLAQLLRRYSPIEVLRIRATTPVMIYSITTLVDVVGTDGLAVEILRTVGETESGHMAYSALQSAFSQYDRTTVSRRLNEKLIEYGLCESTALAETYESRFSTKGVVPRRISQRKSDKRPFRTTLRTPQNQTTIPV